jgi:plasmid stabilization system protein ParE
MRLVWNDEAKASMRQVAKYINIKFGKKYRTQFIQRVHEAERYIKANPSSPKVDSLFEGRKKVYRSVLINNLSKLVYCVDGDEIRISAFWDGRTDAENQAQRIKD